MMLMLACTVAVPVAAAAVGKGQSHERVSGGAIAAHRGTACNHRRIPELMRAKTRCCGRFPAKRLQRRPHSGRKATWPRLAFERLDRRPIERRPGDNFHAADAGYPTR